MNRRKPMPGSLLAFPLSRHGRNGASFVNSVATRMLELSPAPAEKHLARQLDRKADTLRRRGFDAAIVEAEIEDVEAAIRAALWHAVYQGGAT